MTSTDAYRHHPQLRGKIKPARDSFFRDLDVSAIDAHAAKAGFPPDWRTPCDEREAARCKWLEGHRDQDLWIFAYGSLMWDPAVAFTEVRHARCQGYQRDFCLWDNGARGSVDAPGLMLAIDIGGSCEGLAFCVPRDLIEQETFVLFRREMLIPVYRPTWLDLETDAGPLTALGFVANRDHEDIKPGIPLDTQARMIGQAAGLFGTNFDYLSDLHAQLALLGIADPYVGTLYDAARSARAAHV